MNSWDNLPIGSWGAKLKGHISTLESLIASPLSKMQPRTWFTWAAGNENDRLLQLPEELLLEIMEHLPHNSLYLLRQTCRTFHRISMDSAFRDFNLEFSKPWNGNFCPSEACYEEGKMVRDVLAPKAHCNDCNRFRETGILRRKMTELYEPIFCFACGRHHAALFFAPDQRRPKSEGGGICLGRLGRFAICPHSSVTGQDLGDRAYSSRQQTTICRDASHGLRACLSEQAEHQHRIPRFRIKTQYPPSFSFTLDASVLLMEIDPVRIDIRLLRDSLRKAARSPDGQLFCKHIFSQSEQLLSSLTLNGCARFSSGCKKCVFTCQHCGAAYRLEYRFHETDCRKMCVYLCMDWRWLCNSPLTPGWLFNLDFDLGGRFSRKKRHPVFDDEMKHVLWCDSPGCPTGSELRWMRMAKTVLHETEDMDRMNSSYGGNREEFEYIRWPPLEYDVFEECRDKYSPGRPTCW
ncbi:hypothetical protein ACHAPT_011549 [Fusarium lateritium]